MVEFVYRVLWLVIVLGTMILVHEWGHYMAAKLLGVRVEVFSIGFGKRLWGWTRGETDYRLSALPFGGYVKMSGENPADSHTGDPGEFMSHPRWHRLIIAFAGPTMNILLAVGLLTGVYMVHYAHPVYLDQPAVIGWVLEGSPAEKAGMRPGDRIIRIENLQNPNWEDVFLKGAINARQPVDVTIQRGGQFISTTVTPEARGASQYGDTGWFPQEPNTISKVDPGMPAANAGMQVGDEVVALNGAPMRSMMSILRFLEGNKEKPLEVTVVRQGRELRFPITPVLSDVNGEKRYRIGFQSDPVMKVDKLPFAAALRKSLEDNKRNSLLILELVQKMVRGKISVKQVDGPIGIGRITGETARQKGWTPLLQLMSGISLNLGIFNLFPIPVMDGGVILLLLIESVMRRDISLRLKERIYQVAIVFLILFAVMVSFNDISKLLPSLSKHLP